MATGSERIGWGILGRTRGSSTSGFQNGGYVPSESLVRFLRESNMPEATRTLGLFFAFVCQCTFRGEKETVLRNGGEWAWDAVNDFLERTKLELDDCKPGDLRLASFTDGQAVEAMRYASGTTGLVTGKRRSDESTPLYVRANAQGWLYRVRKGVPGHASLYVMSPIVWDVEGDDGMRHTMVFTPEDDKTVEDIVGGRDAIYGEFRDFPADKVRKIRNATGW